MKVAIVTLFPEMFDALTQYGVSGRAVEHGLVDINCFNPREHALDRHGKVDDKSYGGGPGMVMMFEPLLKSVAQAKAWIGPDSKAKVIYLSPQGRPLVHDAVKELSAELCDGQYGWILIAGRYEGIDERVVTALVDEELSIGDYVLSGGELPAMVLLDSVLRMVPGVLGDAQSAEQDSFVEGLLDAPHYTRPDKVSDASGTLLSDVKASDLKVPDVLLSGDHRRIAEWRRQQALERTQTRRPDLFAKWQADRAKADDLSKKDKRILQNLNGSSE